MVEIANKIIVNLIDNIEKYRVNIYKHITGGYTIRYYPINQKECTLQVINDCPEKLFVKYWTNCGASLCSEVIEDEKYELLNNAQKLFRACTNYTSTQMRMFVDSFDEEDLNDL